jgi:hypothetical protein
MIHLLWPSTSNYKPKPPVTLEIGEIEEYDFSDAADQIYRILSVLFLCDLITKMYHDGPEDVFDTINGLINDIDLGSDDLQISEFKNVRIEFRDELLSLEVYVGV